MVVSVSPDREFVNEMKQSIKANNGHCPCALIRNKDTKCMCKDFRDMEEGTCSCGLYLKTRPGSGSLINKIF